MRIIGGNLRGKKLCPVKGHTIRPTSDRVKESIFNILFSRFDLNGADVLDLFAGTGALGIEALSRGAASATFVDKSKAALLMIRKNLTSCSLMEQARVVKADIGPDLDKSGLFDSSYGLVFMDPPYKKNLAARSLENLDKAGLTKGTLVVLEHDLTEPVPEDRGFVVTDQRKYGKTLVSFLNYMV